MSLRMVALAVFGAAAVAASLAAQVEWPGNLADCVRTGTCDCEAVGKDGIRQPINALSSLGLVIVGALAVSREAHSRLRLLGAALFAAGIASFLSHAAVRDWSHTLDSLGVKAVILFLVIYPLTRPRPILAPYTLALVLIWAVELAWPATSRPLFFALVVAAVIANLGSTVPRSWMRVAAITLLLATGAWWLGRSASVLCDPDSIFQPHAMWHLLVAGGLAAVHQHYQEVERQ